MKKIFLLIFIFTIQTVQAAKLADQPSEKQCKVTPEKMDHLKAFLLCQKSSLLGACGVLGAYLGSRVISKALLNSLYSDMQKKKDNIVKSLVMKEYEAHRADRLLKNPQEVLEYYEQDLKKMPKDDYIKAHIDSLRNSIKRGGNVYAPNFSINDGKWVDFNNLTNYDDVVKYHPDMEKYREAYEKTFAKFTDKFKSGKNAIFSFNEINDELIAEKMSALEAELKSQAPSYETKERVRNAVQETLTKKRSAIAAEVLETTSKTFLEFSGAGENMVSKISVKSGFSVVSKLLGSVAAGTIIGADFLLAVLTPDDKMGCATLSGRYTNASKDSCGQIGNPEFSAGVIDFLNSAPAVQKSFLQNHDACLFYDELYQSTFSQSITDVSCMGSSIKVSVNAGYLGKYDKMVYLRDDKSIQSVSSSFPGGTGVVSQYDESGRDISLKSSGNIKEKDIPLVSKAVIADKLYMPEITACCQLGGNEQSKCLKELNKDSTAHVFKPVKAGTTSK